MIERIAKAIHASLTDASSATIDDPWDALPEVERGRYWLTARRVLGVMRTPTDEMLADGDRKGMVADAANVWERMIFRALLE